MPPDTDKSGVCASIVRACGEFLNKFFIFAVGLEIFFKMYYNIDTVGGNEPPWCKSFLEDTTLIQIIYGGKGSGKTKRIVEEANTLAKEAKGVVVYLDRTNHRMHDLDTSIRLVDASHYGLTTQSQVLAFVKGMLAANYDIELVFIDGLTRLLDCNISQLQEFYDGIDALSNEFGIKFVITASGTREELPEFISRYVKD